MIPDSHAHLDLIEADSASVIAEARETGVSPIITVGTSVPSSLAAVVAAVENEHVYAAVGVHPNDTSAASGDDMDRLAEIAASSEKVVAIGETGLDFYRERSPVEVQKEAFRAHARLAIRLGKPVVVHDREAHSETLELLAEELDGEVPVVMHCFSGGRAVLDECVRRGYYLSFAGPVTFKNAALAREMAALVPVDRLLCETDAPFLSPEPHRGKPNVPARVVLVARALAAARGMPGSEMDGQLAANTARAFDLPGKDG